MKKEEITIAGRTCHIYAEGQPLFLLVQPSDDHEMEELQNEADIIAGSCSDFLLCIMRIDDWNEELSPWDAPPVFKDRGFGHGASRTLEYIEHALIPELKRAFGLCDDIPVILGGYSLAALFALWSAYQTDRFAAVSTASPSVWFPGWIEYAASHPVQSRHVYLSLGKKEEKTRNQVMAQVGNCIRRQKELLSDIDCELEWNEGNHFCDAALRSAKGFVWCIHTMESLPDAGRK